MNKFQNATNQIKESADEVKKLNSKFPIYLNFLSL